MKTYDFIVAGSGLAGLSFALKAAEHGKVLVITKALSDAGSTHKAQGGIASVMDPNDSIEKHLQDTLVAGAGLCKKNRVEVLVSHGPSAIQNLIDWGVRFSMNKDADGNHTPFHLGREGGHSDFRILHAEDFTGREIQRALLEASRKNTNIEIREEYMGIDLITNKHLKDFSAAPNACAGLYALDMKARQVHKFIGAVTVICTGGVGQVYKHTTNDDVSTGDGIAMAYRAGLGVEDMEFMQFHPTSFYDPGHPTFLISEALRGHGGILRNNEGEPFMQGVHDMADLAPRDIVARAIDAEMKKAGKPCVFLDMTSFSTEDLNERFPNIYEHCKNRGVDMAKDLIPVVPAAHFLCGGVQVDSNSATALPGLYACGESACTGVHGANRLASNSLLEAVVFSDRALRHALEVAPAVPEPADYKNWDASRVKPATEFSVYSSARENIRSTLWNYVGIVRSDLRLKRAKELIDLINTQTLADYGSFTMDPRLTELRNIALNAELIIKSAQARHESRGLHFNVDYPESSEELMHTVLQK
ncbi:MAG: L-aspartate oxidase [Fibrobacteria bacterium]|nr:L-aspartate oxidase [Fibrobacteria bacterium]